LLTLTLAVSLFADVSYNETDRYGSFIARGPLQRVPSIDPPVFDIPARSDATSLDHATTIEYKVFIKGNKFVRTGKDVSTIFDLDAGTITTLRRKSHTYTMETFDSAGKRFQEMYARWFAPQTTETYSAKVERTGQTKVLEGQTAEEFTVIAIGRFHGRNRVAGRSVYWIVPKAPSEQAAQFQMQWAQKSRLPFPGVELTGPGAFGAMAEAASKLDGYTVRRVTESRPVANAGKAIDSASYDASKPAISQETITGFYSIFDSAWVSQIELSGFSSDLIADDVFTVPAGYKLKKGAAYFP
jgi:hypothetical protein